MAERNAVLRDDKRILYRIGVNLGDVLIEGEDIRGDGVNVAARLEGICGRHLAARGAQDARPPIRLETAPQAIENRRLRATRSWRDPAGERPARVRVTPAR